MDMPLTLFDFVFCYYTSDFNSFQPNCGSPRLATVGLRISFLYNLDWNELCTLNYIFTKSVDWSSSLFQNYVKKTCVCLVKYGFSASCDTVS